jgi:rhodanese-related sulfurtransferase
MKKLHVMSIQHVPRKPVFASTGRRDGTLEYLALAWTMTIFLLAGTQGAATQHLVFPRDVETGETVVQTFKFSSGAAKSGAIADFRLSCACMSLADVAEDRVEVSFTPDEPGAYRFEIDVLGPGSEEPVESFTLDMDVTGVELLARPVELYITLDELDAMRAKAGAPALVDLRKPAAHQAVRIPGSMQARPFELRSKPMFRGRKLVLIDEGYGHMETERVCRRLIKSGSPDVRILHGGMVAWAAAGRPLERLGSPSRRLDVVPALALTTLRGYSDWVLVNPETDAVRAGKVSGALPQSQGVPGVESDTFVDAVQGLADQHSESSRILICGADAGRYDAWRRALRGKLRSPVFYVENGAEGYAEAKVAAEKIRNPSTRSSQVTSASDALGMYRRSCSRCQK